MASIQVSRRLNRRQRRRIWAPSAFLFVGVFVTVLIGLSHYNLHSLQRHLRDSTASHLSHQRRLRPEEDELTILSFGGDSYSELLADTIVSVDYLDLAVACTESIVGNAVEFDAITVPLWDRTKWSSRNRILVDRIRKRFPTAVIVLVEVPEDPLNGLTLYPTSEPFSEWRRRTFGAESVAKNSEMAHAMMQDVNQLKGSWISRFVNDDKRLMERKRSDPLLVSYRLEPSLVSVADAVDFLNLFATGGGLSVFGNHKVADDIRNVVRVTLDQTVQVRKDRAVQTPIKSWGTGDDCHLWLKSGEFLPSTADPVVLPQGTNWHKHALEFRKSHSDSITIHNPFPTERMLFLTYLTDSDNLAYSNTRVFVNDVPTVQIQPFHDHPTKKDILFARSSGVGLVPPGTSTIVLEPVTAGLPFHLVGASILAQEAMEITDVEFDLEREDVLNTHPDVVNSNLHRLFRH